MLTFLPPFLYFSWKVSISAGLSQNRLLSQSQRRRTGWRSASTAVKSPQWRVAVATVTFSTVPMWWHYPSTASASLNRSSYGCPSPRRSSRWTGTSCRSWCSTSSQPITQKCCPPPRNWQTKSYPLTLRSTKCTVRHGHVDPFCTS